MADKEKEDVIEGPGFIIRDQRKFTQEGDRKEKASRAKEQKFESQQEVNGRPSSAEQKEARDKKAPAREEDEDMPLPEVNFTSLVFSLVHSAMLALGNLPDPATGKTERRLPMAKHVIDTIGMLQQKTKGNLTEEEQRLIDDSLFNLRMHYVEEREKSGKS
jgi:hypothetical protein